MIEIMDPHGFITWDEETQTLKCDAPTPFTFRQLLDYLWDYWNAEPDQPPAKEFITEEELWNIHDGFDGVWYEGTKINRGSDD